MHSHPIMKPKGLLYDRPFYQCEIITRQVMKIFQPVTQKGPFLLNLIGTSQDKRGEIKALKLLS